MLVLSGCAISPKPPMPVVCVVQRENGAGRERTAIEAVRVEMRGSRPATLIALNLPYNVNGYTLEQTTDLKNWTPVQWQVDQDYLRDRTITVRADKPCCFYRMEGNKI
jgi:hypothetical protein